MADRYLKATGDWDNTDTWADADDGAPGASFPTSSDNVYFTDMADGLTLTVNVASACIDFVAVEANTATIVGTATLAVSGDVTFLAGMTISYTGVLTISGTGNYAGAGKTLTQLVLAGTAHTISGNNTFNKLKLAAGSTITITPTSTQTIRRLITPSTTTNVTTIQTGGAAATIQNHRGYCELNHVDLTAIVAAEKYRYYAGNNSTDGGGNTNWIFTHKARYVE